MAKWIKCKKPEDWACDDCGRCGAECCGFQVMYHRGKDEALCEDCKPCTTHDKAIAVGGNGVGGWTSWCPDCGALGTRKNPKSRNRWRKHKHASKHRQSED